MYATAVVALDSLLAAGSLKLLPRGVENSGVKLLLLGFLVDLP